MPAFLPKLYIRHTTVCHNWTLRLLSSTCILVQSNLKKEWGSAGVWLRLS